MNAGSFVNIYGRSAIGRVIMTEAIGGYPGGAAIVTGLHPDPAAPEIVMLVKHPFWTHSFSPANPVIGILEHEEVDFLDQ